MSRPAAHINALTVLRFFAALLVVVFHHGQSAFASAPPWCQSFIKGGYVGVPFFFVLSGFILAYNYLPSVRSGELDSRKFWLARFARVYPIYAVALMLGAPLFLMSLWQSQPIGDVVTHFGRQAVLCFGLVQAWTPQWAFAWNGPAWSLSVEAFFYLMFPFLMKQLSTNGRWIFLLGLFCGGGALIGVGRLIQWNAIASAQQVLGWTNPVLWIALFVLGVCMGELHLRRVETVAIAHQRPIWTGLITLGLVASIIVAMTSGLQQRSQLLLCYSVAVPCALLIYLFAKTDNPIGRCLNWRGLVLLGEASYSLYILHRPVHDWFEYLARKGWVVSTGSVFGFGLYLTVCLALSVLALHWIEYPCRERIKRQFQTQQLRHRSACRTSDACGAAMTS